MDLKLKLGLDYIDFIDTESEPFFILYGNRFLRSIPDPYISDVDTFSNLLENYMCLSCEEESRCMYSFIKCRMNTSVHLRGTL
jgi:hypothetical protein